MGWRQVCKSSQLGEGQAVEVVCDGNVVAVFRYQGLLYALDGICMHQGGPLARGKLMDGTVVCPWHGWQYELATGNNATTCRPMLNTYEIREQDGQIEIDVRS